jgi:Cft2 family RNA processing exonuclease
VDAVLLCHSDVAHLGALPYLVGRCGMHAPVYSTLPVRRNGELAMSEVLLAKQVHGQAGRRTAMGSLVATTLQRNMCLIPGHAGSRRFQSLRSGRH